MTEEIKDFNEKALFDNDFKTAEEYYQKTATEEAERFAGYTEQNAKDEKEATQKQSAYEIKTKPIKSVSFLLENMEKMGKSYPEYTAITDSATKYLDNLYKNGLSAKEAAEIKSGKAPKVDIDGSKKSFWGKLKNKAKNFWKPNNAKKQMESQIAELKIAMANNPGLLSEVGRQMSSTEHSYPKDFKELAAKRDRINADLNSTRAYFRNAKDRADFYSTRAADKAQQHGETLAAIQEVRDKAAKEIEQRATARDTTGIKDAQANTGVDRLADKAKAMEGMTPQERLAFRMSQLRGTSKEEPAKPVQKREADSKLISMSLENKMRA